MEASHTSNYMTELQWLKQPGAGMKTDRTMEQNAGTRNKPTKLWPLFFKINVSKHAVEKKSSLFNKWCW